MLTLGILHETLLRWVPPPVRVLAQVHAFIPTRIDPESGVRRPVGTPDSVQVLAVLENGARAVYHFSGVTPVRRRHLDSPLRQRGRPALRPAKPTASAALSRAERAGGRRSTARDPDPGGEGAAAGGSRPISSIRSAAATPVRFTDFATGVAYMEFTEAVARSAETGEAVELPLAEFADEP